MRMHDVDHSRSKLVTYVSGTISLIAGVQDPNRECLRAQVVSYGSATRPGNVLVC